jgi:hypothetical protein
MKRFLMWLLVLLPALAQAQFTFTTNNGAITIAGYTGPGGDVIIPDTINGYPVTVIGTNAFISHLSLTNVVIPDSVINIGPQAFAACSSLTSVITGTNIHTIGDMAFYTCLQLTNFTMPDSVTSIGSRAFGTCASLTDVNIPGGVTNIGVGAFAFCYSMKAINVDVSNPFYSSLDGVLVNKDQTILIQCPGGKTGSYAIPGSITNILAAPFAGCRSLTNVIIPSSISSIGSGMFEYCQHLTGVALPNSITSIGSYAFYACASLVSITIPSSVTSIGDEAFAECFSLSALYFLGNPPGVGGLIFDDDNAGIVYYLPGTTGWGSKFWPWQIALWLPQVQTTNASFGVETNQFGFNINWASGQTVVVEASTNLTNLDWQPVQTNTLTTGTAYFSDPQWMNYPNRFYRLRSP